LGAISKKKNFVFLQATVHFNPHTSFSLGKDAASSLLIPDLFFTKQSPEPKK
jgi:hypothetical protein